MSVFKPAPLYSSEPLVLDNSNVSPGTFTSNLVGGRRVSRRKMRKIYRSYKKSNSSRGKTIKQRLRSLKEGVLSRLFNRSKKHVHRKNKRHGRRQLQRGGSHDSAFLNRALASPNESLQGMLSSCHV